MGAVDPLWNASNWRRLTWWRLTPITSKTTRWPTSNRGSVDLYADIYVDDELYFSSTVNEDAQLPASLDMGGLGFLGIELQQTTRIVLFDEDVSTTEDYVGEVTVELGTLLEDEPSRHTLTNGALQVDLVLRW